MGKKIFKDLVDLTILNAMVEANYSVSGIPIGVVDAFTGEIYAGVGWQKICLEFHRKNEMLNKRCVESDTQISEKLKKGGHFAYRCKNGLWDIGIPIFCQDEHISTIFLGQFFYEGETPDRQFFISQAKEFGLDIYSYLAALDEVPILSRAKVDAILEYNKALADFISNIATNSLKLKLKSEKKYKNLIDNMPAVLYSFSPAKGGFFVYGKTREILGYAPSYLMSNPFIWQKSIHPDDIGKVDQAISEFKSGKDFSIEYRIKDRDGVWHWLLDRSIGRDEQESDDIIEGIAIDITDRKQAEKERERLIKELQDAISQIQVLKGLVPICSNCKKIRDDKWYWNILEAYIEKHSEVSFSHSICEQCSEDLYGDEAWYINMKKSKGDQ